MGTMYERNERNGTEQNFEPRSYDRTIVRRVSFRGRATDHMTQHTYRIVRMQRITSKTAHVAADPNSNGKNTYSTAAQFDVVLVYCLDVRMRVGFFSVLVCVCVRKHVRLEIHENVHSCWCARRMRSR